MAQGHIIKKTYQNAHICSGENYQGPEALIKEVGLNTET